MSRTATLMTFAKLAVAIVAVAGAFAGVSTGTAAAYSVTNSGCPGGIQVPRTNGYGNGGVPSFDFPQRYAWRSSCYSAYTQVITVRYRLWGYVRGTGWVERPSVTRTATVAPVYEGAWIMGLRCATGGCGIYSDPTMGAYIHFVTAY
jgi:hypothetical protein